MSQQLSTNDLTKLHDFIKRTYSYYVCIVEHDGTVYALNSKGEQLGRPVGFSASGSIDHTALFSSGMSDLLTRGGGRFIIKAPMTPTNFGLPYMHDNTVINKSNVHVIYENWGAASKPFTSGKDVWHIDIANFGTVIEDIMFVNPHIQGNGGNGITNVHTRSLSDVVTVASDNTVTSNTGAFTSADLNKGILIRRAGAGEADLPTYITAINNSTSIEVNTAPSTNISSGGLAVLGSSFLPARDARINSLQIINPRFTGFDAGKIPLIVSHPDNNCRMVGPGFMQTVSGIDYLIIQDGHDGGHWVTEYTLKSHGAPQGVGWFYSRRTNLKRIDIIRDKTVVTGSNIAALIFEAATGGIIQEVNLEGISIEDALIGIDVAPDRCPVFTLTDMRFSNTGGPVDGVMTATATVTWSGDPGAFVEAVLNANQSGVGSGVTIKSKTVEISGSGSTRTVTLKVYFSVDNNYVDKFMGTYTLSVNRALPTVSLTSVVGNPPPTWSGTGIIDGPTSTINAVEVFAVELVSGVNLMNGCRLYHKKAAAETGNRLVRFGKRSGRCFLDESNYFEGKAGQTVTAIEDLNNTNTPNRFRLSRTKFKDISTIITTPDPSKSIIDWLPETITKLSDTTKNNDAGLANDPQLQFEGEANAIYLVESFFNFDIKAASDLKYVWSVPAGATIKGVPAVAGLVTWPNGALASGDELDLTTTRTITVTADTIFQWSPNSLIVRIAGTAGTVAFQWAQNSAVAENTILKSGSNIKVTRLK